MSTKICSITKLLNSPHKTSTYAYKTAPIFTAIAHNTTLYSLNQHMFCNLQKKKVVLSLRCISTYISNYDANIIIQLWR